MARRRAASRARKYYSLSKGSSLRFSRLRRAKQRMLRRLKRRLRNGKAQEESSSDNFDQEQDLSLV